MSESTTAHIEAGSAWATEQTKETNVDGYSS